MIDPAIMLAWSRINVPVVSLWRRQMKPETHSDLLFPEVQCLVGKCQWGERRMVQLDDSGAAVESTDTHASVFERCRFLCKSRRDWTCSLRPAFCFIGLHPLAGSCAHETSKLGRCKDPSVAVGLTSSGLGLDPGAP